MTYIVLVRRCNKWAKAGSFRSNSAAERFAKYLPEAWVWWGPRSAAMKILSGEVEL